MKMLQLQKGLIILTVELFYTSLFPIVNFIIHVKYLNLRSCNIVHKAY